jgi:hypothetical protein
MNKTIITAVAAFIVMGSMMASVEEANAVVCVHGVLRRRRIKLQSNLNNADIAIS